MSRHLLPRASAVLAALALSTAATTSLLATTPAAWAASSPVITVQPQSQTAVEFTSVTFTAASDDPAATVNWGVSPDGGTTWYPSSVNDPAGTQTSYTVEAVSSRDAWLYHAVFTNASGSTTTNDVKITVLPAAPTMELQPQDTTVVAGQLAYFYARAWALNNAQTIQWQVDTGSGTFVDLVSPFANQESLSLTPAYADSGNRYRAQFTSAGGTTTSDAGLLTVTASLPQLSQDPQDRDVVAGNPVTFEAGATGDPMPTMQWQRADATGPFTDVPGETSPTITVVPNAADDYDRFRAVFTNSAGSITGGIGVLRVWVSPVITQTSTDQTVVEGAPAVFTVQATGSPTPEIQWLVSTDENATWTAIPGATSDTYSTGPTTAAMSGYFYEAIVSNYGAALVTPYSVLTVTSAAAVPPIATGEPVTRLRTPKAAAPVRPARQVARLRTGARPTSGAAPSSGALPTTGADSSGAATTAAAMLGLGGLLVVAGRRRRRTS